MTVMYEEDTYATVLDLEDQIGRLNAQNAALQRQLRATEKKDEMIRYLEGQIDALQEELIIAERNARPQGTAFAADIPWDDIVTEYRNRAGVHRGPVPDELRITLAEAESGIRQAMIDAATPLITKAVRKAIRRRRARG